MSVFVPVAAALFLLSGGAPALGAEEPREGLSAPPSVARFLLKKVP